METTIYGQVLDVVTKLWEFEGKAGTTHKVLIYSENKLIEVKIKPERIQYYKDNIGNCLSVQGKIFIRGTYSISEIDAF